MYDICIAGKSVAAVNALYYIRKHYPKLRVAVLTNQTDSGVSSWEPSVMEHAKKHGVYIESPEILLKIPNLLFISIEYDKIIRTKQYKTKRIFNIHHSFLPKYKGMYTSIWPILNNEKESGVTLHRIDDGIDTGNIIDQIHFPIKGNYTSEDVYNRYLENSFKLFKRNIHKLLSNKFKEKKQPVIDSTYYSIKSIDFKDIQIDLNKTAHEIDNQIRAYAFRIYQLPKVFGSFIYKSHILNKRSTDKAGSIIKDTKKYVIINTIDYNIILYKDNKYKIVQQFGR